MLKNALSKQIDRFEYLQFFRLLLLAMKQGVGLEGALSGLPAQDFPSISMALDGFRLRSSLGYSLFVNLTLFAKEFPAANCRLALIILAHLSNLKVPLSPALGGFIQFLEAVTDWEVKKEEELMPIRAQVVVCSLLPLGVLVSAYLLYSDTLLRSLLTREGQLILSIASLLYCIGYGGFRWLSRASLRNKEIRLIESIYYFTVILRSMIEAGLDLRFCLLQFSRISESPFNLETRKVQQYLEGGESFKTAVEQGFAMITFPPWRRFLSQLLGCFQKGFPLAAVLENYEVFFLGLLRMNARAASVFLPFKALCLIVLFYLPATALILFLPLVSQLQMNELF